MSKKPKKTEAAEVNTPEAETPTPTPKAPRGPSPENAMRLSHIVERAASEPGVKSPDIARELGISTLSCSQLADRLVRKGDIQVLKIAGGVRTYYPAGFDLDSVQPDTPEPTSPEPETAEEEAE